MGVSNSSRKISLYIDDEKLSSINVPNSDSNGRALRVLHGEFQRNPILTHAVFRDREGHEWRIERHDGLWKRLLVALRAR